MDKETDLLIYLNYYLGCLRVRKEFSLFEVISVGFNEKSGSSRKYSVSITLLNGEVLNVFTSGN